MLRPMVKLLILALAALSCFALAGCAPERSSPNAAVPAEASVKAVADGTEARDQYLVSMTGAGVYSDAAWQAIRDCFGLGGVSLVGLQGDSLPPVQEVSVARSRFIGFRECVEDVEGSSFNPS